MNRTPEDKDEENIKRIEESIEDIVTPAEADYCPDCGENLIWDKEFGLYVCKSCGWEEYSSRSIKRTRN